MWFIPDVNLAATASTTPALITLAQAKIRSNQLSTSERDVIAVLERLVLRDALPVEAPGRYDQAVLMLARRSD